MTIKIVFLCTDVLLFLAFFFIGFCLYQSVKKTLVKQAFHALFQKKLAVIALMVLLTYLFIGLLDSVHFQKVLTKTQQGERYYGATQSLLDSVFGLRAKNLEKTYSAPFALHAYVKEMNAEGMQYYPTLKYIDKRIKTKAMRNANISQIMIRGFFLSLSMFILMLCSTYLLWRMGVRDNHTFSQFLTKLSPLYLLFFYLLLFLFISISLLSMHYHVFGTGKIGQDIFYYSIKSIRTGIVIGLLTTFFMLPFALFLGIAAGFFGGKIDDLIQYVYITLSSIPGVLLIAASVLSMQLFIANHPTHFPTLASQADARLLALCVILGITSWTSLCRLLRAESLKIREMDYIQAAHALGTSSMRIIFKHILPNVMHLVVIAVVLDFSFLVLAEAVLSYIGVGVSPMTISWGNMINGARLELAREPIVWWPIASAFVLMFIFVLSLNLFADALRDAFDPRLAKNH